MQKFKFPVVARSGKQAPRTGMLGSVGFSETIRGTISDQDPVVAAIRKSLSDKKTTEQEQALLRSFFVSWLGSNPGKLAAVVAHAVELPPSVRYLEQVGFLDRTAQTVTNVAGELAGLALSIALLDLSSELLGVASGASTAAIASVTAVEAGMFLIPASVTSQIDDALGVPGTPVKRADFDAETAFSLIRLCRLRSTVANLDLEKHVTDSVLASLDQRAFVLLLANSRQIEGLALSGSSEASAAIASHAAIALGLCGVGGGEDWIRTWRGGIARLDDLDRQTESTKTVDAIEEVLKYDVRSLETRISRQLASASTTEALDLAVVPLDVSFKLMGFVASTMAKATPEGHFKMALESANKGLDFARSATDSTPDAIAKAIGAGITTEAWIRNTVKSFWKDSVT